VRLPQRRLYARPVEAGNGTGGFNQLQPVVCRRGEIAWRIVVAAAGANKLFFDPLRFVRGGNLIDLDWLVETTRSEFPLATFFQRWSSPAEIHCGWFPPASRDRSDYRREQNAALLARKTSLRLSAASQAMPAA
jgi:predicted patatin/cPLA2 family phospholipase